MSMSDDKIQTVEPKVQTDSRTLTFYSNYTAITMSPDEVILRFAQRDPDDVTKAWENARIVLSPTHAKRVLGVLANIISIYENNFGPVIVDPIKRLSAEGRKQFGLPETSTEDKEQQEQ